MKKMVCEICGSTEFNKSGTQFVCGGCGCGYSLEDARSLLREVEEDVPSTPPQPPEAPPVQEPEEPPVPHHVSDAENRLLIRVGTVGHSTYEAGFLSVDEVFVPGPDEVGHIGYELYVKNLQGKPIKYVRVLAAPYNAVGDKVACEVTRQSTVGLRITGPLTEGESFEGRHEGAWYNHSIVGVRIAEAEVEYLDGTKELYTEVTYDFENGHLYSNQSTYRVTVHIEEQLLQVPPMTVRIDGSNSYRLRKGEEAVFDVASGPHTLYVEYQFFKEQFPVEVYNDVHATVRYSNLSGQITVQCIDVAPMTVEPPEPVVEPIVTPPVPAQETDSFEQSAAQFGATLHDAASPNRLSIEILDLGHWAVSGYNDYGAPVYAFVEGANAQGYTGCRFTLAVERGKAIHSAMVYLTPYNALGHVMRCNATNETTRAIRVDGPIYQGTPMTVAFTDAWLNPVVSEVVVEQVIVDYMDGSRELFVREAYCFEKGFLKDELAAASYSLILTRKSQFSYMNTEMTVTVGGVSKTLENGRTVEFVLPGADYDMVIRYGDKTEELVVEMDDHAKLELSINDCGNLEVAAIAL